jgi:ketosteroid isomerase-like protein
MLRSFARRGEWAEHFHGAHDMTRTLITATIAVVMTTSAFAQSKAGDVLAAQQEFVTAYRTCNIGDLERMVTDDMRFIHVGGTTEDRAAFIKGVSTCGLADLRVDVSNVRMYGDAAVLQGMFHYKTKQGPAGTLIISEVFVKQGGAWRFASHQSTAPAQPVSR